MKFYHKIVTLVALITINCSALASDVASSYHSSGFSLGYDVGMVGNGLTTGIRIASPSFFRDAVRVIGSAHLAWAQNVIPNDAKSFTWVFYGLYKLGFSAGNFIFNLPLRVSGAAEFVLLTPPKKMSSKAVAMGLAGSMDFEFFTDPKRAHAVFVNLGGLGLFDPYFADNLKDKPTVANGFTTSFGYRYYF